MFVRFGLLKLQIHILYSSMLDIDPYKDLGSDFILILFFKDTATKVNTSSRLTVPRCDKMYDEVFTIFCYINSSVAITIHHEF